ncbi:unnamed protein product [Trichobilharzia szidati]|nr:unnamed protein product [Trichobilharzia szidati]
MGFSDLGLIPELCSICQRVKWLCPTQIQSAAIPVSLEGKDIVGIAETGSGKTGAFLLPIIQHWIKSGQPVGFALILAPTRELAQQLANEAEHLGQYKSDEVEFRLQVIRLVGGEDIVDQALKLAWRKHHIIVATPGRLVDHLKQSPNFAAHQLSTIRHFVLDEADRMLNMSFAEDIDKILNLYEKPKSQSKKRKKKSKTILEKISESNEQHNGNTSTNNFKATTNPIKSKYPHPQTYLYSATMTKDVVKLRRAALSSNAVFISSNDPLQKAEEQGEGEKSNSTEKINPTDQLQSFTAAPAAAATANSIDTMIKCLKTGFPAGLSHYCLPIRLTDRAAMLDWIVESVTRTNVLEKLGISVDNSDTSSQQNHRIMIFCKRCHETVLVSEFLHERGHSTVALTGRMKQTERKESLSKFISGEVQILVATDVASRGLDIPHVEFVINYNVPLSEKTYRHRVGRTARAGQRGIALTIVTRDVAPVFLELEASLLPYLPKSKAEVSDSSPGIPRWPIPVPDLNGRDSILVRRRLADQAWSRASKTIRAQVASQKPVDNDDLPSFDLPMDEDILQEYANSDNSDDAESDDDDDGNSDNNENRSSSFDSDSGNDSSPVEKQSSKRKLPKPLPDFKLKTSGEAGIAAARKTWKCIAKLNQQQKKEQAELEETHRVNKSIGWGVTFTNKDNDEAVNDNHNMHNDEMSDDEDDNEAVRYEQPIKTKYAKIQASKKAKKNKQNRKFYA